MNTLNPGPMKFTTVEVVWGSLGVWVSLNKVVRWVYIRVPEATIPPVSEQLEWGVWEYHPVEIQENACTRCPSWR